MNNYFRGDIIKIVELYQDRETLYWNPIRDTVGLLLEEIDDDLMQVLVAGRKETHDIGRGPYTRYKVEVISKGNINE